MAWVGTASALDGEHGRRRQPTSPGPQPTGNLGFVLQAAKINHAAFFELDEGDPACRRVVLSVVFACEIKPQLNYDSDKPLWFGCSVNLVLL